jgi:hypothetical protein
VPKTTENSIRIDKNPTQKDFHKKVKFRHKFDDIQVNIADTLIDQLSIGGING